MIDANALCEDMRVRFKNGDAVSLEWIAQQLTIFSNNYRIPMCFWKEQVKLDEGYGCIEGLLLYHPNHFNDYKWFVFTVSKHGLYAFVNVYLGGYSQQSVALYWKNELRSNVANMDFLTMMQASRNEKRYVHHLYEEETQWYAMVRDAINESLGVDN